MQSRSSQALYDSIPETDDTHHLSRPLQAKSSLPGFSVALPVALPSLSIGPSFNFSPPREVITVIQIPGQSQALAQPSMLRPGSEVGSACSHVFLNEPVWPEEGRFRPQNTSTF